MIYFLFQELEMQSEWDKCNCCRHGWYFRSSMLFVLFLSLKTSNSNGLFFVRFIQIFCEAQTQFNKIRKGELLNKKFVYKEKMTQIFAWLSLHLRRTFLWLEILFKYEIINLLYWKIYPSLHIQSIFQEIIEKCVKTNWTHFGSKLIIIQKTVRL